MTYVTCFTLEFLYNKGEKTVMLMKLLALHLFENVQIVTNSCHFIFMVPCIVTLC